MFQGEKRAYDFQVISQLVDNYATGNKIAEAKQMLLVTSGHMNSTRSTTARDCGQKHYIVIMYKKSRY